MAGSTLKHVDTAAALAGGSTTRPLLSQPWARALPLLLVSGPSQFKATSQPSKGPPETEDRRPKPLTGTPSTGGPAGWPPPTRSVTCAAAAGCVPTSRSQRPLCPASRHRHRRWHRPSRRPSRRPRRPSHRPGPRAKGRPRGRSSPSLSTSGCRWTRRHAVAAPVPPKQRAAVAAAPTAPVALALAAAAAAAAAAAITVGAGVLARMTTIHPVSGGVSALDSTLYQY